MPGPRAAPAEAGRGRAARSGRWAAVRRAGAILFALLVLGLLANHARTVDWGAVIGSVRATPLRALGVAGALALASYAVYCSFDLIGRWHTEHALRPIEVAAVAFTSYAFNLNFGSLVGGIAFRYRLYGRLGLNATTTSGILALSLATNWLGYFFLAGGLFLWRPLALPPAWGIGSDGLHILGALLWLGVAGYLALCAFARGRVLHLRGHGLELPSIRIALLQIAVAALNWLLIGGVLYVLLQQRIDYPSVLSVLLVGAVAGVVTHVPAGLGVLEAVFVALLSHRATQGDVLGALVVYRAIYYLAPLACAAVLFPVLEAHARRRSS
jgi:uncharacterized membrane protein YbhN (UPF0104 family)